MGALVLHGGASAAVWSVQRWLGRCAGDLRAIGTVAHRVGPEWVSGSGPLAEQEAWRLRVVPVTDGPADADHLSVALASTEGSARRRERLVERLVNELREQARIHGRVVVSASGLVELLTGPEGTAGLARLRAGHEVHLVIHEVPSGQALLDGWRRSGWRTGERPSTWLRAEVVRRGRGDGWSEGVEVRRVADDVAAVEDLGSLLGVPGDGVGEGPPPLWLVNHLRQAAPGHVLRDPAGVDLATLADRLADEGAPEVGRLAEVPDGMAAWAEGGAAPDVAAEADRAWRTVDEPVAERRARLRRWARLAVGPPLTPDRLVEADVLRIGAAPPDRLPYRAPAVPGRLVEAVAPPLTDDAYRDRAAVVARAVTRLERLADAGSRVPVVWIDAALATGDDDAARALLAVAGRLAAESIRIRHPHVGDREHLREHGLKVAWDDWPSWWVGRRSLDEVVALLEGLGAEVTSVVGIDPIAASDDPRLLPYGAPPDQLPRAGAPTELYDPALHGPRPRLHLDEDVPAAHDLTVAPFTPAATGGPSGLAPATVAATGPRYAGVRLVDLGAGTGESLERAEARLGVTGVGIELDADKVRTARERGRDVHRGDIRQLDPEDFPDCEYVWLDNVLEHLPDLDDVGRVLGVACRMATRLVVVVHPSFEDVDRLAALGVKLYWTDWTGHTAPARVADLVAAANAHGCYRVVVQPLGLVRDVGDPKLLPLGAPPDQVRPDPTVASVYREELHGPKPDVAIDWPVYTSFELLVATGAGTPELRQGAAGERPELRWREIPGHAPAAWGAALAEAVGDEPLVARIGDGRVVVVEAGRVRPVPSPLVAHALGQRFEVVAPPAGLERLPTGPPVVPLKVPGQPVFVVVGGVRFELPRLPTAFLADDSTYAELEQGGTLDVLRAASDLRAARARARRAREGSEPVDRPQS